MLLKPQAKNKLYDTLHYGVVYILMGTTVMSTGYLGWLGYRYFNVSKPQKERQLLEDIKAGKFGDDLAKLAPQTQPNELEE